MATAPDGDAAAGATKRSVPFGDDSAVPPPKVARLSDLANADLSGAAAAAIFQLQQRPPDRGFPGPCAGLPPAGANSLQALGNLPRTNAVSGGLVGAGAMPSPSAVADLQALLHIQQLQRQARGMAPQGMAPQVMAPQAVGMPGQHQMLGQLNRQLPQQHAPQQFPGMQQHAPQQFPQQFPGMGAMGMRPTPSAASAGTVNPLLLGGAGMQCGVGGIPAGPPSHPNGIVTINFEVPSAKVKDILGVKGMNIRAVKQRSGIQKITILDRSEPATVSVTGTPSSIETCKYLVLQIASGDQTCVGNATETINIDAHLVPRIIGPRGQTITAMKDQSGSYIEVRKTPGQQQQVICTGPPEAVQAAKILVLQFLAEQGMAGAGDAGAGSGAGGGGESAAMEQYAAQIQMAQYAAQLPAQQQLDIAQLLQGGQQQQQHQFNQFNQFNSGLGALGQQLQGASSGLGALGQQLQGLQEIQGLQNLLGIAEQQLLGQNMQGGQSLGNQ